MRRMALTAEMIASVPSVEDDGEPSPGMTEMTDADHEQVIATTLAQRPAGDLWVFAYGSLLWKPAFEANEVRPAIIRGWHRSFCFRVTRFRGTNDRPGLMLGLDRGGQCRGMILRVPTPEIRESLKNLFRRELVMKPTVYDPRWVTAETPVGPMAALAFVVDRTHERYVGRLTLNEVADMLASAAGPRGSCAEYLYNTVAHLEELGVRDRNLWRLQRLVAERISPAHSRGVDPLE